MSQNEMIEMVGAEVIRETEKAYQIEAEIDTATGQREWKVWLPKKFAEVTDGTVKAAAWIVADREGQIAEWFEQRNQYGVFFGILTA